MILSLPDDVLHIMLTYLHTSDLARVSSVRRGAVHVPDELWTTAIRRRCGPLWPGGRAGVVRLYTATHALPTYAVDLGDTYLCAGVHMVCAVQSMGGLHTWCNGKRYVSACNVGRAACACLMDDSSVVVGNEYGLMSYPTFVQLWSVAGVVSVASLHDGSLWFTTADQRAYSYVQGAVTQLQCSLALCASGPWGLVGTLRGTYPVPSLPLPCSRIEQSSAMACAWFIDGSICTFMHGQVKHVVQTGVRAYATFSVIGDVVCLGGVVWRDGERIGVCDNVERRCSADARHVLTRMQCGNVGTLT